MSQVFAELMQQSMSRGVADAQLRVWAPQGAQVVFVRQVAPTVEDLTNRRVEVNPLTGGYPTGSWGDESRDYHVSVRLSAKGIGQEQLAARVQLAVGDQVVAQGLVKAKWSDDEGLTTRINPEVAHYTGQTELAEAIQEGLAAKAAGDEADGDHEARPGRPAGQGDRQRRGHHPAAQGGRHRQRGDRHRAAQADASTRPTRWRSTPRPPRPPGSGAEPMSAVCPAGHTSAADDYCDVCGMPIDASAVDPRPARPPPADAADHGSRRRASRSSSPPAGRRARTARPPNAAEALFCENCGYDFTTGHHAAAAGGTRATDQPTVRSPPTQARRTRRRVPRPRPRSLRLGGRGLDRPGLVRGSGEPRPDALPRPARRRAAARHARCSSAGPRAAATSIPRSTARPTPGSAGARPS